MDAEFIAQVKESIDEPCISEMLHWSYRVFVAEKDEKVVGFASWTDDGCGYDHMNRLQALYVDPDCQGTGIGKTLINQCAHTAAYFGHKGMMIGVINANQRARTVYERLGAMYSGDEQYELGRWTVAGTLLAWHDLEALMERTMARP